MGKKAPRYKKRRTTMRIHVRGVTYDDVHAAAKALGVKKSTVYSAVLRGTTDTLGLGPINNNGGAKRKPLTIGPVTFSSQRAASKALGFSVSYVSNVLRKGSPAARARLIAHVMQYHRAQEAKRQKLMDIDD